MTAALLERDPVRVELRRRLVELRTNGPHSPRSGICFNIRVHSFLDAALHRELTSAFREWPEYSGDSDYPVPGGQRAYENASSQWTCFSDYSRARRRLLNFLIDTLE